IPRPTSRMTEVIPHTMPNIVRKLRSFVSQSAESVCLRISWNGIGGADPRTRIGLLPRLRKNHCKGSLTEDVPGGCVKMEQASQDRLRKARMVKSADTADLKSADPNR